MTGKTHLAAGITTAVFLCCNIPQITIVALGAVLPDIDHEKSALGHYVPIISKHIHHRTVTHSIFFLLICSAISPYLGIGVLTHIILDMFNTRGIQLFWPLKKSIKVPIMSIHTGKKFESIIYVLCMLLLALGLGYYHYKVGILNIVNFTTITWK
ncbi:MAG: metal-dependent hydrolase [Clostridia bacterium]|nr:metal-dependent hydrolase [Clostridia bacterium]